jgi:glycosyltransferase involved in cell wall biosynthesis
MKYLHIVSIFPALTETFVLREARKMRDVGCEVVIGQLRPVGQRPTSPEFEDLRPCVVQAAVPCWSTLKAVQFFARTKPKETWTFLRLTVADFPSGTGVLKLLYILLASAALAYRLRDEGISHVHAHHLHSEAVAAMMVAGFLGLPYSFKCYTVKTYYPETLLVKVTRCARFVIADTHQVQAFLVSRGADPRTTHLLRNALPLADFRFRDREPSSEPPIILAVGRLDYKKGFHVLLSACSLLREQGIRFRCVIVGDGDQREDLLHRKTSLNLDEHVDMVGEAGFSEVQQWYERATLLVMPSVVAADGSTDGLPTVIVEAFACGVPVIGTLTAGIPEVIQDGTNGWVVSAESPHELAGRMAQLLLSKDLRQRFAIAGRRTVERDHDLDRSVQKFSTLMHGQASVPNLQTAPLMVSGSGQEEIATARASVSR